MKKEEVVHLHKLLFQMKLCFEENGLDCDFQQYNELGITPLNVQRSKGDHKRAVFLLASELASKAVKKLSSEKKNQTNSSLGYVIRWSLVKKTFM